eukprot:TRINITY_DN19210_c0_g1_i1.p1 TRINITY_DN19210_c0_g1~~TRINITY_DN19210_c0_g1_i1.p1  ORF type:complete len:280 (+),score=41.36 TRINITY_DN19210_c0_g1_i1:185-1024(+)
MASITMMRSALNSARTNAVDFQAAQSHRLKALAAPATRLPAQRTLAAGPLRSQFFGRPSISGSLKSSIPGSSSARTRSFATTVSEASFFEKLGKMFAASEQDEEQVMAVFEINDQDKGSPFFVKNTPATLKVSSLGDFVPYSNKVYDCTLTRYLGNSQGLCVVMEHHLPKEGGDLYETTMSHYMGDYGHISCHGPYRAFSDTKMAVVGGTGIFAGARGWVLCQNLAGPLKLIYTYHIKGIPKLPAELTQPADLVAAKKRPVVLPPSAAPPPLPPVPATA